jgi:hypothetical protein
MDDTTDFFADADVPRARVALLLNHLSRLSDDREPWRIAFPLAEVLLLLSCATIASCDDFDEIAAWGEHHLDFLRRFAPFHHGVPCERWLRTLVNRVDPLTFARCFEDWIRAMWPARHDLIAIDRKTSRRTHDRRKGHPALHLLRAARHRTARRRLARPLGRREHALGARRRVQGRPVSLPRRPRRQEHGRRPSLLTRPHPRRQIEGEASKHAENRRAGIRISSSKSCK